MKIRRRDMQTIEMQMGPLIDMVFLLLVFFMVTAKPIKPESDVGITLPGTVSQESALTIPDEQRITIRENGQVFLNELAVDSPDNTELPKLRGILERFRKTAEANKVDALVTIYGDDTVPHQRVIDVMNTCAAAGIQGVTFGGALEEETF